MTFPLDGLSSFLLAGMLTVLPVCFVAWYPSRRLLGIAPPDFWHTPLAALALSLAAAFVFRRGLKHADPGAPATGGRTDHHPRRGDAPLAHR